jgi:DNA-binding NarL/FixJ family response regulator
MPGSRVLIADDHPSVLARVSELVVSEFDVVAAVTNGQAALDAAAALQPDVLILDISMPILSGLEAAARLVGRGNAPPIVFLTVHEDAEFVDAARSVGARGYVLKRSITTDLLPAIRRVLDGESAFPHISEAATVQANIV